MDAKKAVEKLRRTGMTDEQIADRIGCTIYAVRQWGYGTRGKGSGLMFRLFKLANAA